MKSFTDKLNRLKTALSLTMDKDVAKFLGFTKSAFAERKRRGVFPEEALRLADLANPELKLDIDYILKGDRDPLRAFLDNTSKMELENPTSPADFQTEEVYITPKDANTYVLLNFEEVLLLNFYRRSDSKGKATIFDVANMSKELSMTRMKWNEYTENRHLKDLDDTE